MVLFLQNLAFKMSSRFFSENRLKIGAGGETGDATRTTWTEESLGVDRLLTSRVPSNCSLSDEAGGGRVGGPGTWGEPFTPNPGCRLREAAPGGETSERPGSPRALPARACPLATRETRAGGRLGGPQCPREPRGPCPGPTHVPRWRRQRLGWRLRGAAQGWGRARMGSRAGRRGAARPGARALPPRHRGP